jgi:hypothetical protein
MKAGIALAVSLLVFGGTLAVNLAGASFMGNFGGPDDMPPPGFETAFLEGAIRATPVYIGSVFVAALSGVAIFRRRKKRSLREPDTPADGVPPRS